MKAAELKKIMFIQDISTEALAKEIGMSKNTLYSRIKGKTSFTVQEVLKICEVLNIQSDEQKAKIFLS